MLNVFIVPMVHHILIMCLDRCVLLVCVMLLVLLGLMALLAIAVIDDDPWLWAH